MRKFLQAAAIITTTAISSAYAAEPVSTNFINTKGEKIGTARLKEMENGTLITIDMQLPEGAHAIHIHEKAKCDAPDFKTSGGHFNPESHKHGLASKEGFHAGDMPNLFVESTGHVKTEIFSDRLHLAGKNGLANGATIIVHEKGDDYTTDPTGNAGNRIACAVIK